MEWTPPFHGVTMRQDDTHAVCGQGIRGATMDNVSIIGLDISKRSFQVHGATADGAPVLRRKLTRAKVLEFLASQPACLVVMEACGGALQARPTHTCCRYLTQSNAPRRSVACSSRIPTLCFDPPQYRRRCC